MTLQEYLVKLGFSVDDPSLKRFMGSIASVGAGTAELGSTVVETGAAIEAMVDRVARKYETLYYVSQRTGQSVKYIQATQYSFKQIGLSAEEANASIESMAAAFRTQPWLRGIFGNVSTPQQAAERLGKSGLPYFLQTRFAEMIGMDEKTLLHWQQYAKIEASARAEIMARQQAAGVDPQKLADDSVEFGRALNSLETSLDTFGDKMAQDFIGPVTTSIHWMDEAVQWITHLDVAMKGWVSTLGTIAATAAATAGGLWTVERVLRRILGLSGKTATGAVTKGLFSGGSRLLGGGLAGGLSAGVWGALYEGLATVKENNPETKKELQDELGPILYQLGLTKSADLSDKNPDQNPAPANESGDRRRAALDRLMKEGFSAESAAGIVAGLYSESGLKTDNPNPTTGANGIAQWLGSRKAEFANQYHHDVSKGTFQEQLDFLLWELNNSEKATGDRLRKGGLNARDAAQLYIHGFERPGSAGEASDMRTAGPLAEALSKIASTTGNGGNTTNINLHSKTDVTVQGGEGNKNAKAYSDAHNQANANAIRLLTGVTQ